MFLSSDVKGTTIWIESIMIPFARGGGIWEVVKLTQINDSAIGGARQVFLKCDKLTPSLRHNTRPVRSSTWNNFPSPWPSLIDPPAPGAKEGLLVKFCFFTFHVEAAKFVPCNWGATLFRHVELPLHKRPYEYYSKQMSLLPAIKNKCRSKAKVFKKLNAGIKFRAQLIPGQAGK